MFIQRSSGALCMVLFLGCSLAEASPPIKTQPIEAGSVLEKMPEAKASAFRNKKYLWIEYCPDNTCDVLRTSAEADPKVFATLGGAYYFYFSRYIYLEDWKRNENIRLVVEENLNRIKPEEVCGSLSGKRLAKCLLERLEKKYGLQVLFVRFDERGSSSTRIPFQEAMK